MALGTDSGPDEEKFPDFGYIRNEVNEASPKPEISVWMKLIPEYVILMDVDTIVWPDSFRFSFRKWINIRR
jgi:hypothetical protein